ncbi:SDR family oxidoreductase [Fulvivirga sp.]|uniref:SDR family oxidoreductase n=1 Tax=Fulvivirga sp. TaxID=1931237 RepID=UPI0032EAB5C7
MKDKVIIVTGGSGLLGREMVSRLLKEQAIVVNLDLNPDDLNSHFIKCDLTNDQSIYDAIDEVLQKYGKIDGLVNNAYPRTKDWGDEFENIKPDSWRSNVDMQLNSYFVITQKVLAQMKLQNYGSIVNIASIYGVVGNDFTIYEGTQISPPAAYAAIKGGLINFTKYLASRYGQYGVRINALSPGGIFDNQDKKFVSNYEKKVPMKRMGKPDDIAPGVLFLLSDDSKYITGHNLIMDGGWTSI